MKSLKGKVIEIVKKLLPNYNDAGGVFEYGDINPIMTDYYIRNSVTAHAASNIMTAMVVGKGVSDINEMVVNNINGNDLKLYKFATQIARSLVNHKGVFIHRNLNMQGKTTTLKVMPFASCLLGKNDDNGYSGKIHVKKDWTNKDEKTQIFDVWNDNPEVIKAQFDNQGKDYKGQILFYSLDDELIYPLPRITPVINDCDSEINASIYKSNSLNSGFFGKHIFITPPFVDPLASAEEKYVNQKEAEFQNNLKSFMGAENVGNVLHFTMEFDSDEDIEKRFKHIEIKTNIDDKLFAYTESSTERNILKAFNNCPQILVANPETGVYGNSGEQIKQAKIFYQESTENERKEVESILKKVLKNFVSLNIDVNEIKITPLIEVSNVINQ